MHWPRGIKAKGELRTQFHHVIDIAPTVLEAAGIPEPTFLHGMQQKPYEGVSMAYSFDDAKAAERRETQYFEMFVNRGIYHEGWTAVTRHSVPWVFNAKLPAFDDDVWELHGPDDWTQTHNIAQGGELGGWSFYTKDGKLKYAYNLFGVKLFTTESSASLLKGKHQVRMEFAYAGGGLAKGGKVMLYVDGQPVGEGQLPATQPLIFSADETCDVGNETGSTVTPDYTAETSEFNGVINWVQLDQGADDNDHLITPEERLNLAMARQ